MIYKIKVLNDKIKLTKILGAFLALVILFFVSKLMLKGVGVSSSEKNIFLLSILLIILSASKKSFFYLVLPMCFLYAFYSPIGATFGKINYAYISSFLATDLLESKEFFSQIPLQNYFYPIFIIIGIFLYQFLVKKNNIEFYKNKTLISIFIIFSMLDQAPAEFFKKMIKSFLEVRKEIVLLNKIKYESNWGSSNIKYSKYDNYILVIGESARKDYHNAYGYPVKNTPFMSNSNGFLVDGLTSGGNYTIGSLRLMLTKPDKKKWEPNYSLTLIDLVKSAGIKTYWLSNQGYLGLFDTPISAIAEKSDYKFFFKTGDHESINTSDFSLLDKVKDILRKSKEKRLIVVHLYGSHPNACDRIADYKKIVNVKSEKYAYLDCYISSINKTDDFLSKLNSILMEEFIKNNSSYSLLYFSDHGLAHKDSNGVILFNNSLKSKFHFDIPLFQISSDSNERKECISFKSGLNFIDGLGAWIGIQNDQLNVNYNLFDCKNDPSDYGLKKLIDKTYVLIDPAINISGK